MKPTIRQKKLAKKIIENQETNKTLNKSELVESVGYSKQSGQKKAGEIIESKGTQLALKEYGFDEESAKDYVKKVLKHPKKEENGLKAADMIFKVHGTYAPEKQKIQLIETTPEKIAELKQKLADKTITDEELDLIKSL